MAKVVTLSRQFPSYHPKAGQPTYFVENVWASLYRKVLLGIGRPIGLEKEYDSFVSTEPFSFVDKEPLRAKRHTIRIGRRWKDGDMASIRVWSGKPYNSPQIKVCEDVKVRVVNIVIDYDNKWVDIISPFVFFSLSINDVVCIKVAANDGLSVQDLLDWFQVGKKKGVVEAQIIIWGDVKEY
jgi:hypothetical protein